MIAVAWLLACTDFEPPKFEIDFVQPIERYQDCEALCDSSLSTRGGYTRGGCLEGCRGAEVECPDYLDQIYDCFWAVELGLARPDECDDLLWAMDDSWVTGQVECNGVSLIQPGDTGWF